MIKYKYLGYYLRILLIMKFILDLINFILYEIFYLCLISKKFETEKIPHFLLEFKVILKLTLRDFKKLYTISKK